MNLRSMTGFGRAYHEERGLAFEVLIKGVNSRFAEFNFKLPPALNAVEQDIRSILQKNVTRGKVTLLVNGHFEIFSGSKMHCDYEAVKKYLSICRSLGLPIRGKDGQAAVWEALRQPGTVICNGGDRLSTRGHRLLDRMIRQGLKSFLKFKADEGRKIASELSGCLRKIDGICRNISKRADGLKADADRRIRDLAARYAQNPDTLRDRIGFEIASALDRLDISEECARLKFHIDEFRKTLSSASDPARGRKLDFLLQEMHREINTIGSKGRDTDVSRWVVEAKDYVERMREQVQNVE